MKYIHCILIVVAAMLSTSSCTFFQEEEPADLSIAFEKWELDNGLDVVLHVDRSDPVVAVALTAHVGSAREKAGRTGFAHLFEHLFFLESENLGRGGLDKMSARIGGSGANGSTSRDLTNYFQTVPNDALEKMIWAEADKLGWFINTVTEPVLAKEKQVVKNEKRQGVDNRPYGHTSYVIDKHLYPGDHPYNWQVIGSLEDLQNAALSDVKEFYRRWYVPNNATLVIAGDFDPEQAKEWVRKYFDEIPRGEDVEPLEKRPGQLTETIRLYHEDNFARLPELTLAWPAVELFHPDSYALEVLGTYLSQSKNSPLYKVIVEEMELAPRVNIENRVNELAGQTHIVVRTHPGKDLDSVYLAVEEAFERFAREGIPANELERIKARQEAGFYRGLSTVLGKGFQLANYNILAGDPGFVSQDIQNTLSVDADDVMRVFEQYLQGKAYVATSFVPKGRPSLALQGSEVADVVEEPIVMGAEEEFDASQYASYDRTPSSFDRTKEPPHGPEPISRTPEIWEDQLSNGLKVFGIENIEVPLVYFEWVIDGGPLLDPLDKVGVANLLAQMLTKGTRNRTTRELEEAIEQLGASISVSAGSEEIVLRGSSLARNYEQTLDLVREIILEPRWDQEEYELAVERVKSELVAQQANPNAIAGNLFNEQVYGPDNIKSRNPLGTVETLERIRIEDLKEYYARHMSPSVARLHVVGSIGPVEVMESLEELNASWAPKEVNVPEFPVPSQPDGPRLLFYDVPNAKQSVIRIGYPALAETDPEYYPAVVANYRLGGGGFAARFMQVLRESKGYTYGIGSGFEGSKSRGPFTISSGVRTNVTLESLEAIRDILSNYADEFSEQDLEVTKSYFIKSNARAFESAGAKLSILRNIGKYGWDHDYVKQREEIVQEMTVKRIKELSRAYLDGNRMIWLVVGDAETQFERLGELGLGEPLLLNPDSPEAK